MKEKEIIIYTSPSCINCNKLKGIFDNKNIKYITKEASDNMEELVANKVMSLPGLKVDGVFVNYEEFINKL